MGYPVICERCDKHHSGEQIYSDEICGYVCLKCFQSLQDGDDLYERDEDI